MVNFINFRLKLSQILFISTAKRVIECHMIQKVEQNIARPQEIKSVIFGTVDLDPLYIDVVSE